MCRVGSDKMCSTAVLRCTICFLQEESDLRQRLEELLKRERIITERGGYTGVCMWVCTCVLCARNITWFTVHVKPWETVCSVLDDLVVVAHLYHIALTPDTIRIEHSVNNLLFSLICTIIG